MGYNQGVARHTSFHPFLNTSETKPMAFRPKDFYRGTLTCNTCGMLKHAGDFDQRYTTNPCCLACQRAARAARYKRAEAVRNTRYRPTPNNVRHGHPPPFLAGTPEYAHWHAQIRMQHRQLAPDVPWPQYYAQAKVEAAKNPPEIPRIMGRTKSLFGGAKTKEYQAWRYRTHQACKALPLHEQNWPEFFKAAREAEERRQGLKPSNIVPFNPVPATPEPEGERLMFDFALPEDQE